MEETYKNFIETFIDEDLAPGGRCEGMKVHTRFPPEPNGYLHIGHCKALVIDFGTAEKYGGLCNLRMDDTNPTTEDVEYVEAIQEDIHWLGFDWGDRFYYASDYFEKMYECAEDLIKRGLAYVCELTPEQFREYRGDVNTPARSPWRDRPQPAKARPMLFPEKPAVPRWPGKWPACLKAATTAAAAPMSRPCYTSTGWIWPICPVIRCLPGTVSCAMPVPRPATRALMPRGLCAFCVPSTCAGTATAWPVPVTPGP